MEFDVIGMMAGDFVEHEEDRQLHQHPRRRVTLLIEDIFGRIEVAEEFVDIFVVSGGIDERFARFIHTEFFKDQPVVPPLGDHPIPHQIAAVMDIGRRPADVDEDKGIDHIETPMDMRQRAVDDVGGGVDLVGGDGVELLDLLFAHDVGLIEVGQVAFECGLLHPEFGIEDILQHDQ